MQIDLTDEEMVILLAGFQTIQAVGTETMRRIVSLEVRIREAHDGARKAQGDATKEDAHENLPRLQGQG